MQVKILQKIKKKHKKTYSFVNYRISIEITRYTIELVSTNLVW